MCVCMLPCVCVRACVRSCEYVLLWVFGCVKWTYVLR